MRSVRIEGGPEYACANDDTLLRAGLRSGIGMPYECNAGSCGTCKVELLEGQVTSLRPDAPGLGERDRARNRVLACQSRPSSDCRVKVRLRPENVPVHRPARFRATLEAFRDLTHANKMFDLIAMRKPAIVSRTQAVEAYFDDSSLQLFTSEDEHDLARAIRELHADPALRERLVQRATDVQRPYRWIHQRRRYLDIVARLASGPDARARTPGLTANAVEDP